MNNQLLIFHIDMNFVNLHPEYIKCWLKKIADMGYNAILWELENKVQWDTCPECVWPEAMSKAVFKELLAYSRELGLEPIPLLQTIGHGEYVLLHDEYRSFRELPDHHDCYCTSNPEVRTFFKDWIVEYLELFGELKYFHLGGDEAYVFGKCDNCSQFDKNQLYAEYVNTLAAPLLKRGIRPGIWCDMVLHYPESVDAISQEFIIWDWNYWNGINSPDFVRVWGDGMATKDQITPELKKKIPEISDADGNLVPFYTVDFLQRLGYDVILCSSSRSAGDSFFIPQFQTHAENIAGAAAKTRTSNLHGNCVTSWAIRLNSYEQQQQLISLAPEVLNTPGKDAAAIVNEKFPPELKKILNSLATFIAKLEIAKLTAVQWNGWKDSLPAPENYVAGVVERFEQNKDAYWKERESFFGIAIKRITSGLNEIEQYPKLESWAACGKLQLQFYTCLKLLFGSTPDYEKAQKQLEELRQNYEAFLAESQTPQSAAQNAKLVMAPLQTYASYLA